MGLDVILQNVLSPPVLFFFLGLLAVILKSDLDIPQPIAKLLSIYLLISIGIQGGYKLSQYGLSSDAIEIFILAMIMAVLVPIYAFFILRFKLDVYNAVAIAATYGSVSAVTFITATNFLNDLNVSYGGYMVAVLALMESPAIIIGLLLLSIFARSSNNGERSISIVLREAFLNTSVFLLIGSLFIGFITGEKGYNSVKVFFDSLFVGFLSLFLLDMGIIAARRLSDLKKVGTFLIVFAIALPLFNASIGILLSKLFNFNKGDAFLFSVLCASSSYIAVPAAMRISVPEANPSLYLTMSLVITFPFNIIIGLPLYYSIIRFFLGG